MEPVSIRMNASLEFQTRRSLSEIKQTVDIKAVQLLSNN